MRVVRPGLVPMTDAACHTHPEAPAIASCSRCFALLCRACRHIDGVHTVCGDCLRSARRKRRVTGAVAVLFVAAATAGGYWLYAHHKTPYDYGRPSCKVS